MSVKQKSQDSKKKLSEIDDQILKSFDIKRRLGKGAYGIVWKAIDKKTEQTVAVKKIFDAFRNVTDAQRTFREIMFLRAFRNHPNIIQLHSVHKAFNHMDIYLSFEFMESDLHNVIKRGTILKDVHKRYVMYQLFNATKYIHSGNVIHRDLKPSNVLIDSRCRCKIADFGLARSVSLKIISGDGIHQTDPIDPILTDYVATRWYRAPEILVASKRYTKGIDLWSLGCILGEMIRGKPLFPGSCTVNQVERIVSALPNICEKDIIAVGASFGSALLNQTSSNVNNPKLDELLTGSPEDAKLLVKSLLVLNPNGRLTAKQALLHKYIEKFRHASPEPELSSDVIPPFRDDIQLSVQEYRSKLYELMSTSKVSQASSISTSSDNQNNNNNKQQQQQKPGNSKYLTKKIRDNNIQQKLESTITVSSNNNINTNSSSINSDNKKSIYSKIQNQTSLVEQDTKLQINNLVNDPKQQQHNYLEKKNLNYTPTVSCIALEGVMKNQQNLNNNTNTNNHQQYVNQSQQNLISMNGMNKNLKSIDTNNRNRNIINNNDLITINTNNINSINNKQTKLKYCKIMNYSENNNNINNVNNIQNINTNYNNNQKMMNKQNHRISGGSFGGGDRTGINLIDRRHSIDCSNYKNHQQQHYQQNSLPNFSNSIDVSHISQLNSNNIVPTLQHTKTDLDSHLNEVKRAQHKLQTVTGSTNTPPATTLSYFNVTKSTGPYKGNSKLIIKDNNNENNNIHENVRNFNSNYNNEFDNEMLKKQQQQQQQDLVNLGEQNIKKSQPDYYENRLKTLEEKIRQHKMDIKSFLCQNNKLKISKLSSSKNSNNNKINNNDNNNNNNDNDNDNNNNNNNNNNDNNNNDNNNNNNTINNTTNNNSNVTNDGIKASISQVPEIRRRPIYTSTSVGSTQSEHNIRSRIDLKCTKSDSQQYLYNQNQNHHHHHHHQQHHNKQFQSNPIKFEYTFSEGDYCSTNKNITHNNSNSIINNNSNSIINNNGNSIINNNNNNTNNNNNNLKLLTNNKATNYGVISSTDLFKLRSSEILS